VSNSDLYKSAYCASIGDVIDDVTRLYDVIIVTSQYSKSVRKLGPGSTIRVDPLSTHYRRTLYQKLVYSST